MSATAGDKSYAGATKAWAPDEPQPTPDTSLLVLPQQPCASSSSAIETSTDRSPPPVYDPGVHKQDEQDDGEGWAAQGSDKPGAPFKTSLRSVQATVDNPIDESLKDKLAEPYVPRANIAATPEVPHGTQANNWAEDHKNQTVLQQHVLFFDKDQDGYIFPLDIYKGFHDLGYAFFWCLIAVFIISPAFALFTAESFWVLIRGGISVKHIHRAKHGSDTGVYDTEGRFVPSQFESIFSRFDTENKGGLTFVQGLKMLHRNRNILDPVGWIGEFFEQVATYLLIWPKDGVMTKEDWRTVYDGSIFFTVAARERERRAAGGFLYKWVPVIPGLFVENRAAQEPDRKKTA